MDHAGRLDRFRRMTDAEGLDGYWVVDAANVRYLCGFSGHDSTLVVSGSECVLITDSRYAEQAEHEVCADRVINRRRPMVAELGAVQRLLDRPGELTLIEVAAAYSGAPVDRVVQQLSAALPGAKVSAVR